MTSSLPAGYIDTTAAVERIVRNARNGNLYSNWPADAWRKLCGELIPKGHVRPLMLTADGFVRKADVTQFAGFADKYSRFETFFGYQPSDRSYDLLDEHGRVHRFARAIFLESEIETAFGMAAEPLAISAPPPEKSSPGKASPVLAAVADAEIVELLKEARCTNMNVAWTLVKATWPGVTQKRLRALWKREWFGGRPGRRVKCVR